jgi:hypothetical protein
VDRPGAVVLDVGINRLARTLTGDVEFGSSGRRRDHSCSGGRRADDDSDAAFEHARRCTRDLGSRTLMAKN